MSTLKTTNIQNASSATTNIALDTSGNVTVGNNVTVGGGITASSGTVVMSSPYTMRNKIINGAMMIDQRNAGASVSTASSNTTYTVDRFQVYYAQTSKFTIQQNAGSVTPPSGYSNYLGITSSSSYSSLSGDYFFLRQSVEGLNIPDLAWGTSSAISVTLSFWVRSSLTGTFSGVLRNGAENLTYAFTYSVSSANTWEQKTITIAGPTSGTWLTTNGIGIEVMWNLGSGSGGLTGTTGSWVAGGFFGATGSTSVVGTNGATFYITGVQLERGTAATPFEYRNYQQELAMCQRYYVKSYDTSTVAGTVTQNGAIQINASSTSFNGCCNTSAAFPSEMRTAGTATYYSPITGASGKAGVIGGADFNAQGVTGTRNISMSTTTGPASASVQMTYHYTVSSEL